MPDTLQFSSLIGQEKAKAFLGRMFVSRRLAHAYLFRGPDGVGKRLCASLVAARLNCIRPSSDGACGDCPSCRKFRSANHPDIVFVAPEGGTIKIDTVRELCRSLSYPPYESGMRVLILEDVHSMGPAAANSLLKTLEEPPPGNVLILTAESSRQVLPTISSRCQVVTFYPLTDAQASQVIMAQLPGIEEDEARLLAGLAGGSPGTALSIHEKELMEHYRDAIRVVVSPTDGLERNQAVSQTLLAAGKIAALKDELPLLLGLLRMWVRDRMLDDTGGDQAELQKHQARLAALERAERQLARNCNRALVCEVLLFNLQ